MTLHITTFAILKEYFSPAFVVNSDIIKTVGDLKQELIRTTPSSSAVVKSSRFAIDEIFVNDNTKLHDNASIYIVPPSSGG
jgi:molybdopterin converting factor small subunit